MVPSAFQRSKERFFGGLRVLCRGAVRHPVQLLILFVQMRMEDQPEAKPVCPRVVHLLKMLCAKACFVCFNPVLRLHEGGAEIIIDAVVLKAILQIAHRTFAGLFKCFVYGDRINRFFHAITKSLFLFL